MDERTSELTKKSLKSAEMSTKKTSSVKVDYAPILESNLPLVLLKDGKASITSSEELLKNSTVKIRKPRNFEITKPHRDSSSNMSKHVSLAREFDGSDDVYEPIENMSDENRHENAPIDNNTLYVSDCNNTNEMDRTQEVVPTITESGNSFDKNIQNPNHSQNMYVEESSETWSFLEAKKKYMAILNLLNNMNDNDKMNIVEVINGQYKGMLESLANVSRKQADLFGQDDIIGSIKKLLNHKTVKDVNALCRKKTPISDKCKFVVNFKPPNSENPLDEDHCYSECNPEKLFSLENACDPEKLFSLESAAKQSVRELNLPAENEVPEEVPKEVQVSYAPSEVGEKKNIGRPKKEQSTEIFTSINQPPKGPRKLKPPKPKPQKLKPRKETVRFVKCTEHEGMYELDDEYALKLGDTFPTVDDFVEYTNANGKRWKIYYTCISSLRYPGSEKSVLKYWYRCSFHKPTPKENIDKVYVRKIKEKQRTQCPSKILLAQVRGQKHFTVLRVCHHHDHPFSEEMFHELSHFPRLPSSLKEEVYDLLLAGMNMVVLSKYLFTLTGLNIPTGSLHNAKLELRRNKIRRPEDRKNITEIRRYEIMEKIAKIYEMIPPKKFFKNKKDPLYREPSGQDKKKKNLSGPDNKKVRKRKSLQLIDSPPPDDTSTYKKSRLEERLEALSHDQELLESVRYLEESNKETSRPRNILDGHDLEGDRFAIEHAALTEAVDHNHKQLTVEANRENIEFLEDSGDDGVSGNNVAQSPPNMDTGQQVYFLHDDRGNVISEGVLEMDNGEQIDVATLLADNGMMLQMIDDNNLKINKQLDAGDTGEARSKVNCEYAEVGVQTEAITYHATHAPSVAKSLMKGNHINCPYFDNENRYITEEYINKHNIHIYLSDEHYIDYIEGLAKSVDMKLTDLLLAIYNGEAMIKITFTEYEETRRINIVLTLVSSDFPNLCECKTKNISETEQLKQEAASYCSMIKMMKSQMEINIEYTKGVTEELFNTHKENIKLLENCRKLEEINTTLEAEIKNQKREIELLLKKQNELSDLNIELEKQTAEHGFRLKDQRTLLEPIPEPIDFLDVEPEEQEQDEQQYEQQCEQQCEQQYEQQYGQQCEQQYGQQCEQQYEQQYGQQYEQHDAQYDAQQDGQQQGVEPSYSLEGLPQTIRNDDIRDFQPKRIRIIEFIDKSTSIELVTDPSQFVFLNISFNEDEILIKDNLNVNSRNPLIKKLDKFLKKVTEDLVKISLTVNLKDEIVLKKGPFFSDLAREFLYVDKEWSKMSVVKKRDPDIKKSATKDLATIQKREIFKKPAPLLKKPSYYSSVADTHEDIFNKYSERRKVFESGSQSKTDDTEYFYRTRGRGVNLQDEFVSQKGPFFLDLRREFFYADKERSKMSAVKNCDTEIKKAAIKELAIIQKRDANRDIYKELAPLSKKHSFDSFDADTHEDIIKKYSERRKFVSSGSQSKTDDTEQQFEHPYRTRSRVTGSKTKGSISKRRAKTDGFSEVRRHTEKIIRVANGESVTETESNYSETSDFEDELKIMNLERERDRRRRMFRKLSSLD